MLRTLQYVEGMYIEQAVDDQDLVTIVNELQDYFDMVKSRHLSFKKRPGLQSNWVVPLHQERVQYFYQGLPSCSSSRSRALYGKFPVPTDLCNASVETICEVPGIGHGLATKIYDFLRR